MDLGPTQLWAPAIPWALTRPPLSPRGSLGPERSVLGVGDEGFEPATSSL